MYALYFTFSGNVNYAKFQETWKSVAKEFGCEERVRVCFDLFASLSGKDDTTVINIADLDALIDFLAGVGEWSINLIFLLQCRHLIPALNAWTAQA